MKHYGDITKLNGYEVEPVNVIIGGSPCQGLSVAGKGMGLDDNRSKLFLDQIRIIKEMRRKDSENGRTNEFIRPRFMVWENVPGSFSKNKGADFQKVLEETVKVVCKEAPPIPIPKHGWPTSGCLTDMGGKWSIAWRVFDAQFWGVPQRRKRIALIADFGGITAPEILFERESMSGDLTESGETRQGTSGNIKEIADKPNRPDVKVYDIGDRRRVADESKNISPTLTSKMGTGGGNVPIMLENHPQDSRVKINEDGISPTLTGKMGTGGGNVPMVINVRDSSCTVSEDVANTIVGSDDKGVQCVLAPKTMLIRSGCDGGGKGVLIQEDKASTLSCSSQQTVFVPEAAAFLGRQGSKAGGIAYSEEVSPTIRSTAEIMVMQADSPEKQVFCVDTSHPDHVARISDVCPSIVGRDFKGGKNVLEVIPIADKATRHIGKSSNGFGIGEPGAAANTLTTQDRHAVAYAIDRAAFNQGENAKYGISIQEDVVQTLVSKRPGAVAYDCRNHTSNDELSATIQSKNDGGFSLNYINPVFVNKEEEEWNYIIRRLTPLECERLMDFPDGWTDIGYWSEDEVWTDKKRKKKTKRLSADSLRYKAIGNSIALPPWAWVLKRLSFFCGDDLTMASLFDGIGGFPLIWERLHGPGLCLWASEIELFPMAVTKRRFSGENCMKILSSEDGR